MVSLRQNACKKGCFNKKAQAKNEELEKLMEDWEELQIEIEEKGYEE